MKKDLFEERRKRMLKKIANKFNIPDGVVVNAFTAEEMKDMRNYRLNIGFKIKKLNKKGEIEEAELIEVSFVKI
jgi:hypothetical protein